MGRKQNGFSMIEIMIVLLIIGIIVGIAVPIYTNAQKGARDKRRLADMQTILAALEAYKEDNGNYPPLTSDDYSGAGGWNTTGGKGNPPGYGFIHDLVVKGYLRADIYDPQLNDPPYGNYRYYRYGKGDCGADSSRGDYFVLSVRDFERVGNGTAHPDNPGFSTPGRNWYCSTWSSQTDYCEWVTGGYQYD